MRTFLIIWFGQTVSMLGSSMTTFALSIWIFEQTGSATALTLTLLVRVVPSALLVLYAGVIVDRFSRKRIMLLADVVAAINSVVLLALISSGLQVWHIYLIIVIGAPFGILQHLAYDASLTMMVNNQDYVRVGSMGSLTRYTVAILGPAFAAPLYLTIGLGGIVAIDLITFFFAAVPLLIVTIPNPEKSTIKRTGWQQVKEGFSYIRQHPNLYWLLGIHVAFEFFQIIGQGVKTPMILARTGNDETVLAAVSIASGVGGILAALLMSSWGGGAIKRLHLYFYGSIGGAIGKIMHGLSQVPATWVGTQLFTSTNFPVQEGAYKALWMEETDPAIQGRMFALSSFAMNVISIPALLIAGPLADVVFEPAMQPDGTMAGSFGWLIGTGAGAGFSLLFSLCGVLMLIIAVLGFWKLDLAGVKQPTPITIGD